MNLFSLPYFYVETRSDAVTAPPPFQMWCLIKIHNFLKKNKKHYQKKAKQINHQKKTHTKITIKKCNLNPQSTACPKPGKCWWQLQEETKIYMDRGTDFMTDCFSVHFRGGATPKTLSSPRPTPPIFYLHVYVLDVRQIRKFRNLQLWCC